MNITVRFVGCSVLGLFLFFSCAPKVYIISWTDPLYTISAGDSIAVRCNDEPDSGYPDFCRTTESALDDVGFCTVERSDAKYILLYEIDEDAATLLPKLPLSGSTKAFGGVSGLTPQTAPSRTNYVPARYDYPATKLYFVLYPTKDANEGIKKIVWEGYIGAWDINLFNHTEITLEHLFGLIGNTEFEDFVRLSALSHRNRN